MYLQSGHTEYSLKIYVRKPFQWSMRINGGSQVKISCIINSILTELCVIPKQYMMKDLMMFKHALAKLNTKTITTQLKRVHILQVIRIHTFIKYGLLYVQCSFTYLIRYQTLFIGLYFTRCNMHTPTAAGYYATCYSLCGTAVSVSCNL
jgi:hypothetical protein